MIHQEKIPPLKRLQLNPEEDRRAAGLPPAPDSDSPTSALVGHFATNDASPQAGPAAGRVVILLGVVDGGPSVAQQSLRLYPALLSLQNDEDL